MRNNRTAGNNYERKIVNELKELGYPDCVTSRAESRNMDNKGVDIISSLFPFYVQCKLGVNTPNISKILNSKLLPTDKPLIIIFKKNTKVNKKFKSDGEYVIMKKEDFYNLIKNKICV